jgi:hypothetical protein
MKQSAPYPDELADLVEHLRYRPGWRFRLADIERDPADTHGQAAGGLTFIATTNTINAYHPEQKVTVNHYFIVPAATYNRASWQRWLFDCMTKVELHECMEFFAFGSHADHHVDPGLIRPYAPTHAPGDDPYIVHEYAEDAQRRTSFRGELNP